MTPETADGKDAIVLVEGPAWGDAEFYGRWLLAAAKAQKLVQQAKRDDEGFQNTVVDSLETLRCLDFGIMATVFLSKFVDKEFKTFLVAVDCEELTDFEDLMDFALMVEMGFFILTGDRYQMTVPAKMDVDTVKDALRKLAETEDEDWVHPEQLVVAMPKSRGKKYQHLLGNMTEAQRLADRKALLFVD